MANRVATPEGQASMLGDWPVLAGRPPVSEWTPPGSLPDLDGVDISMDTETKDLGLANGRGPGWVFGAGYLCGVSVAWADGALYAPIRHPDTECMDEGRVVSWVEGLLRRCRVHFFNGGYDMGWLRASGCEVWPERMEDASSMAAMDDENHRDYDLDACCQREGLVGKDAGLMDAAARAYGVEKRNGSYKHGLWRLPARYVGPYAEADAVATLQLGTQLRKRISDQGMDEAYRLEIRLLRVVHEMRRRGIRIDERAAEVAQGATLQDRDSKLAEIAALVGRSSIEMTDVVSPARLAAFFDAEGISYPRTAKTSAPSFTAEWLEQHPSRLAHLVREARQLEDTATKFLGGHILGSLHRGRIHAEIHTLRRQRGGTVTTRLAYSEPPLQQMPSPDRNPKLGKLVRDAFLPEDGEHWYAPDYCFSSDTEVLARRGWVVFPDLLYTDECAQVDPVSGALDYALPTARQRVEYQGEMIHVSGGRSGAGLCNLLVTPNHRCLVYPKDSGTHAFVLARNYPRSGHKQQWAAYYEPKKPLKESFGILRLVAAIQADAGVRKNDVRWRLSRKRKIDRLHALLDTLNVAYRYAPPTSVVGSGSKGTTTVRMTDVPKAVWRWMDRGSKTFSRDILELPIDRRMEFLSELPHWDGRPGGRGYFSTNVRNVELAAELGVLTGVGGNVRYKTLKSGKQFAHVKWYGRDRGAVRLVQKINYDGTVHCVTMPRGTVVVRRGGVVSVTGQSQQEPRLGVHFASVCNRRGAEDAIAYYRDRGDAADFHQMVVDMTSIVRPKAKIINLGMIYGMGRDKLARSLGVTRDQADEILELYHRRMPWVRDLQEYSEGIAANRGYIRLIDGARRHYSLYEPARGREEGVALPLPQARERWPGSPLRRAFTRTAMNSLIQGSAARQTKIAMVLCAETGYSPLITMHDEICFSVDGPAPCEKIKDIMVGCVPLRVPVKVDAEVGPSWGTAKTRYEQFDWRRAA